MQYSCVKSHRMKLSSRLSGLEADVHTRILLQMLKLINRNFNFKHKFRETLLQRSVRTSSSRTRFEQYSPMLQISINYPMSPS